MPYFIISLRFNVTCISVLSLSLSLSLKGNLKKTVLRKESFQLFSRREFIEDYFDEFNSFADTFGQSIKNYLKADTRFSTLKVTFYHIIRW